ncbi:hypothetical protein M0R45_030787 [Rubus argutus]|uniref:Uncharacterized protein n=1 Tax=Rubus argutus TaxID=59490 RepID=A0AAW1WFA7_RUBAR
MLPSPTPCLHSCRRRRQHLYHGVSSATVLCRDHQSPAMAWSSPFVTSPLPLTELISSAQPRRRCCWPMLASHVDNVPSVRSVLIHGVVPLSSSASLLIPCLSHDLFTATRAQSPSPTAPPSPVTQSVPCPIFSQSPGR